MERQACQKYDFRLIRLSVLFLQKPRVLLAQHCCVIGYASGELRLWRVEIQGPRALKLSSIVFGKLRIRELPGSEETHGFEGRDSP